MNSIKDIKMKLDLMDISEKKEYIDTLFSDNRAGVQKLIKKTIKQIDDYSNELKRIDKLKKYELELKERGYRYICGIDEVGRGPLAGPVVACAIILDLEKELLYVNDSKKLSEKKREEVFKDIEKNMVDIGFGIVDNKVIDEINILNATKLAMKQAISKLKNVDFLLIDAVKLDDIGIESNSLIKGDEKSISIAAASIMAKVTRDKMMEDFHKKYPYYDFLNNKGYGTKNHIDGIKKYGITDIHRRSFINFESQSK